MPLTLMQRGAVIVGAYRYHLWREWNTDGPHVTFIMLNPSTADGMSEDATLRRCIDFAQKWSFGRLSVVNLFALRSPSPRDLLTATDPIGPENDRYLLEAAASSACLIAAWGCHGRYLERDRAVLQLLAEHASKFFCLGCNADGTPRHPLYIRKGTERQCFP